MKEIWLQWWTRANEQHPNQHVWYWLSIYAALGVLSLFTAFLGSWYVHSYSILDILCFILTLLQGHNHDHTAQGISEISRDTPGDHNEVGNEHPFKLKWC